MSERVELATAGGPVRVFVALPVPVEVRHGLEDVQATLRERTEQLSFTRPDGWHVTLAFLGDVAEDRVAEVRRAVAAATAGVPALRLALGGPGRFGDRALWVGVEDRPRGTVAELGERVQVTIAAAELPVQRRPVRPHLTLARGGRGRPVRARHLDDLAESLAADHDGPRGWIADEVQVWRSELGRGPARYHVLESVPLAR